MISVSESKEGRIFKISMLYMHRAHVENPLVTSFEVTSCRISTHLTCSGRQKSLWIRQGCICLQSLCLQAPACPFVDGMNKAFLCYSPGPQRSLTALSWEVNNTQTTSAAGPRVAVGTGDGRWAWEKRSLSWMDIFPLVFTSSKWQHWVYGRIPEWSNNSVPFGDQMFLSRC